MVGYEADDIVHKKVLGDLFMLLYHIYFVLHVSRSPLWLQCWKGSKRVQIKSCSSSELQLSKRFGTHMVAPALVCLCVLCPVFLWTRTLQVHCMCGVPTSFLWSWTRHYQHLAWISHTCNCLYLFVITHQAHYMCGVSPSSCAAEPVTTNIW